MRPVANQPESQTIPCKPQRPHPARRLQHHVRPLDLARELPESPPLRSDWGRTQPGNLSIQFLESGECAAQANSAPRQRSTDRRLAQHFLVCASPAPPGCARPALQTLRRETKRPPTRPLCFRFAAAETPSPTSSPT